MCVFSFGKELLCVRAFRVDKAGIVLQDPASETPWQHVHEEASCWSHVEIILRVRHPTFRTFSGAYDVTQSIDLLSAGESAAGHATGATRVGVEIKYKKEFWSRRWFAI
jgi:hypothetical protein